MAPRLLPRCWAGLARATTTTTTTTTTRWTVATDVSAASLLASTRTGRRSVTYGWSTLPKRGSKPTRFNQVSSGLPAPTTGPAAALKRREHSTPVRTGVLAIKRGMTGFYSKTGTRYPCTILELESVQVVANKTREKNGYWAVQVGCGDKRAATVDPPLLGYYEAKGIAPKQHLAEFKVRTEAGLLTPGTALQPDWFSVGQCVDVRANSRGFGFAGGMKRHGFSGQNKSHGNSKNHRTMGTTGPSQGSGSRVLPGKKMPGRMGNERVTVQNLPVLQVDNELGIVIVKGCVGGPKGQVCMISDAVKKPPPSEDVVAAARRRVEERSPLAAKQLAEARAQHLVLKEARKNRKIAQLLENGMHSLTLEDLPEPVPELIPEQAQPEARA